MTAGSWVLDRTHSMIGFSVRHLGISKVRGSFRAFDAELTVGESLADTTLSATVQLATVHTNNPMRDAHLRTTDFFSVEMNPTMTFSSRTIADGGNGILVVTGDLSLNGITRTQRFDVECLGAEILPLDGTSRAGFAATGRLSRKDHGIDFNAPLGTDGVVIGDLVEITLDIQLMPAHEAGAYHEKFMPEA